MKGLFGTLNEQTAIEFAFPDLANETAVAEAAGAAPQAALLRVPTRGDRVLAFHTTGAWYPAAVSNVDKNTLEYTVDWQDGDATGRVVASECIALDVSPIREELGMGSEVIFPQGRYVATEGKNDGGHFHWLGVVTGFEDDATGELMVRGHHKRDLAVTGGARRSYEYEWVLPFSQLRVAPNSFVVLRNG